MKLDVRPKQNGTASITVAPDGTITVDGWDVHTKVVGGETTLDLVEGIAAWLVDHFRSSHEDIQPLTLGPLPDLEK